MQILNHCFFSQGDILLWREISLEVICEKVKFFNFDFYNHFILFLTMTGYTYKLFKKNMLNDFLTKDKAEINMV